MAKKVGKIEFDDESKVSKVEFNNRLWDSFVSEVRTYGKNAQISMSYKMGGRRVIVIVVPE